MTLAADATDDVGLDHVDFMVNGTIVGTDATAPYTATWHSASAPDGDATVNARAVDTSTNATTSSPVAVTVDNTGPDTTIDSGPQGVASDSTAFAFSSQDNTASFQCNLDGSSFSGCTSPQQFTGLTYGAHTVEVRAKDTSGNLDATPASGSWTVDITAPDTTIASGPNGTVISRSAQLRLHGNGAVRDLRLQSGRSSRCLWRRVRERKRQQVVRPYCQQRRGDRPEQRRRGRLIRRVDRVAVHLVVRLRPRATLASSQNDLTVSGDFDVTVEGASGLEVPIFKLYDSSSVRLVYVYRRNVSGRIYVVWGGTTYMSTAKLALGSWAQFSVRTVAGGSGRAPST
jgi:hypothetical protein